MVVVFEENTEGIVVVLGVVICIIINFLPNNKILDLSKLKAFSDDKINVKKFEIYLERVANIVGKGENAGYQHFLLFLQCFQKASISRSLKVGIVLERDKQKLLN